MPSISQKTSQIYLKPKVGLGQVGVFLFKPIEVSVMVEGFTLRRSPGWQMLMEHLVEYDPLDTYERNHCLI